MLEDSPEGVDFKQFASLALRHWWAFVAIMAAAGAAAYGVTSLGPPLYSTTAKVLVQSARVPGVFSAADIEANRRFAEDFGDIALTRSVLESVADALESDTGTRDIGIIETGTKRSIVSITVLHVDSQLSATVANALAEEAIEQVQRRQLTQIAQFQASLQQYGIGSDVALIAGQASTLTTLSIIENAVPSPLPVASGLLRNVLLAMLFAFGLVSMILVWRDHFDDRVRSADQLRSLTGVESGLDMMSIGSVLRYRGGGRAEALIIDDDPPRALTEAYKFLQTNLQFAALDTDGVKTILVTSTNPEEGKTTTSINIATSIAREGSEVILVDADLRRPNLHRIFELGERDGLTHLLLGKATLEEVAVRTRIAGLRVIPAGVLPSDPPMLLRSKRMREVIAELAETADVVFFDSPPLLAVTDAMIVASLVDAVLLVVESDRTRTGPMKLALQAVKLANPKFIGTVLNKVVGNGVAGYGNYYYYLGSEHGRDGHDDKSDRGVRRFVARSLGKLRIRRPGANGARRNVNEKDTAPR